MQRGNMRGFASPAAKHKVAMIGSGNWGSAAVKLAAETVLESDKFENEIKMWVHEEIVDGEKLTDIINRTHINTKYLPNRFLGENVVAVPDLLDAVEGADLLVICVPHQFMGGVCQTLAGVVPKNAKAISLTKGLEVLPTGPQLMSEFVEEKLGVSCSVLMGANVADGIAACEFSEATVGYKNSEDGEVFVELFNRPYFHVAGVQEVAGVEMCGTLKNIVALSAGFIDGLGLGSNSKAAIIRIGLGEMRRMIQLFFPGANEQVLFESCGIADLITTCFGGRNRKVAEEYVRHGGKRSFEDLETELLNGQKLQGVLTSHEVQEVLKGMGKESEFPLFTTINKICAGTVAPEKVVEFAEIGRV